MIGRRSTDASPLRGVHDSYPWSRMWLSRRQTNWQVRSHFSVHEAFV